MPLNPATLTASILELINNPPSVADMPSKWADVILDYAAGSTSFLAVPPVPPSNLRTLGKGVLVAGFQGAQLPGAFLVQLPTALISFAGIVVANAAQVSFAAVPPPVPLILTLNPIPDARIAAQTLATQIDLWFRTGLAGPIPPGVPAIPWS